MRKRLPSQRFVLRRFGGMRHTRHVETQQVGKRATRKEAAARAAELSRQYPRDAVLLVRGDRVLTCYVNGSGARVSAVQRAVWEQPAPAALSAQEQAIIEDERDADRIRRASFSSHTPRERVEGFFK